MGRFKRSTFSLLLLTLRVLMVTLWSCPDVAQGIKGGTVVTLEQEQELPWHVTLVHYSRQKPQTRISKVYCGGTLVTKR